MTTWAGPSRFPTSRHMLEELERQEYRRGRLEASVPPRVSRDDLEAAWRAVGRTDEVVAVATVGRYWWRRALVGHARHAAPEL